MTGEGYSYSVFKQRERRAGPDSELLAPISVRPLGRLSGLSGKLNLIDQPEANADQPECSQQRRSEYSNSENVNLHDLTLPE